MESHQLHKNYKRQLARTIYEALQRQKESPLILRVHSTRLYKPPYVSIIVLDSINTSPLHYYYSKLKKHQCFTIDLSAINLFSDTQPPLHLFHGSLDHEPLPSALLRTNATRENSPCWVTSTSVKQRASHDKATFTA